MRNNNGRLLASRAYLAKRGWFSAGVIHKAKQELLDTGFIFETVKGQRPNRASWYAITWQALDRIPGYDAGAIETFNRSAHRLTPCKPKRKPPECKKPKKILSPAHGTEGAVIVPSRGTGTSSAVPSYGAIKATICTRLVPRDGNHLEMPSTAIKNHKEINPPLPEKTTV